MGCIEEGVEGNFALPLKHISFFRFNIDREIFESVDFENGFSRLYNIQLSKIQISSILTYKSLTSDYM